MYINLFLTWGRQNCKFTKLPREKLRTIFQELDTVDFIKSDTDFSSSLLETAQAKPEIIYLNFLIFQVQTVSQR